MKKKVQITMRVSKELKNKIDAFAEKEGLPYQTLINSILHKYVTGQFVEEKKINKVVTLFASRFSIRKRRSKK